MRRRPGTNGSSLVSAEQLGHDLFVRTRAGTPRGNPLVMCREGGLDLRLFQGFRRGVPFYRTEPPQIRERDDGGGLPAEVDHLVRLFRVRLVSRLHTHTVNGTGDRSGGPGDALRHRPADQILDGVNHGPFGEKNFFIPDGHWAYGPSRECGRTGGKGRDAGRRLGRQASIEVGGW